MKDIIRIGMFVAVEEPNGKTAKLIGVVLKKYEAQITKIVDAITATVVKEFEVDHPTVDPNEPCED